MKQVVSFFFLSFTLLVLLSGNPAWAAADASNTSALADAAVERVDINSADAETIARVLTGVGLKKAQAIVAWRETNGKFESIEQLTEVKGVGPAILDKNRDKLTLN